MTAGEEVARLYLRATSFHWSFLATSSWWIYSWPCCWVTLSEQVSFNTLIQLKVNLTSLCLHQLSKAQIPRLLKTSMGLKISRGLSPFLRNPPILRGSKKRKSWKDVIQVVLKLRKKEHQDRLKRLDWRPLLIINKLTLRLTLNKTCKKCDRNTKRCWATRTVQSKTDEHPLSRTLTITSLMFQQLMKKT